MTYQDDLVSPPESVVSWLVDSHCHPTDEVDESSSSFSSLVERVEAVSIATMVVMATRSSDQSLVAELALRFPEKVVPAFGFHPWFVHTISLDDDKVTKRDHYQKVFGESIELDEMLDELPHPTSLSTLLIELHQHLTDFPNALVGEIGIDRAFRIPNNTKGGGGRQLSKLKTPLQHQLAVVKAQIGVAVQLSRNISFHSVQAAGKTVELMRELCMEHNVEGKRFSDINICFHSCTLDANIVKTLQKTHTNTFIGFSSTINHRHSNHREILTAADPKRLLVESDWHSSEGIACRVWQAVRLIAEITHGVDVQQTNNHMGKQSLLFSSSLSSSSSSNSLSDEKQMENIWKLGAERLANNWQRFCTNYASSVTANAIAYIKI